MAIDVEDLDRFYVSPLGQAVSRQLAVAVSQIWPKQTELADRSDLDDILALGFAGPICAQLWPELRWALLMQQQIGGVAWPSETGNRALVVDDARLPLRDNLRQQILVMHALELSADPLGLLSEVTRVLAPGGRALFIVPNRAGFWARNDATPFGAGRPFSSRQLKQGLRAAGLTPLSTRRALFVSPRYYQGGPRSFFDRGAAFLLPEMSGVLLVEATKLVPARLRPKLRPMRPALIRRPAVSRMGGYVARAP